MRVFAMTDVGRVRPINEDSYYLPQGAEQFCAVADGMGGHNAGEVASALAVETFAKIMRSAGRLSEHVIHTAVVRANEAVFREAGEDAGKSGMGTTFSALAQQDGDVLLGHVGDSRIYLVRHGAIMQLTTDHTLVEEMVRKGMLTPREARFHPRRNIITRALGTDPDVEVDILRLAARPGDVFFLCSDGMTNYVEEKDILHAALNDEDWDKKLRDLVSEALENGGADNITALFAIIGEEAAR